MSILGDLYQNLFKEYKQGKKPGEAQKEFNKIWAAAKQKYPKKADLTQWASDLLVEYVRNNREKNSFNILNHCSISAKNESKPVPEQISRLIEQNPSLNLLTVTHSSEPKHIITVKVEKDDDIESTSGSRKRTSQALLESSDEDRTDEPSANSTRRPVRATPAQDKLKNQISFLEAELESIVRQRDPLSADLNEQRQIKKLRDEIDACKKELRKKEQQVRYSKTHRHSMKTKIELVCRDSPNVANVLKVRSTPGRPRLEEQQPDLLKTIVDLAMLGASTEERHPSEIVHSSQSLTELHGKLTERGFKISKSGTYLRLLPKNYKTIEGKRHVATVPVKLSRPEINHNKVHPDEHFCCATTRSLETVASILGPDQVFFLSQNDKARIPIGMTAANIQAPLLMHVEYPVSSPEHDWTIASKHKLIPSVYAASTIKANDMGRSEAVTYSGPTYVAIRSAKHSPLTASSHAVDFNRLAAVDTFKDVMRNKEGYLKPVIIISSDGGPDENPRYAKVISHAVQHFLEHDLDAIFIFTNAPGRSASNGAESKIAHLSRELSDLILPHDSYGSHLDAQGRTIDFDLEKQNFQKAGEVLVEVWNSMVIDQYKVVTEYILPDDTTETSIPDLPSPQWYSDHVRESQYLLQVVKCDDRTCCGDMRSSLRVVLPERFLLPPYPILQTPCGLDIPKPEDHDGKTFADFILQQSLITMRPTHEDFDQLPYDFYCPSLRYQLVERTCNHCGLYFCTKKNLHIHMRAIHYVNSDSEALVQPVRIVTRRSHASKEVLCVVRENDHVEWLDEEEVDFQNKELTPDRDDICPLVSVDSSQTNPWCEDTAVS